MTGMGVSHPDLRKLPVIKTYAAHDATAESSEETTMTRRGTARSTAMRLALEAKAGWDAERARHDAQVQAALTDYYQATAQAERIRVTAQRKADSITRAAEQAAAAPVAKARYAVRRLRELLGGNAEVAALCGLTQSAVRDMLATSEPASGDDDEQ